MLPNAYFRWCRSRLGWQRLTLGLALRLRFGELREFFGDRRHVGSEGFFKQPALLDGQVLCLDAEVLALVVRHFMRQLVDLDLTPVELPVIARNDLRLLADQFAQFVGAQLIEVGGQCHGRHDAVCKHN